MVHFELTLQNERDPDWKDEYINYKALKESLKSLRKAYDQDQKPDAQDPSLSLVTIGRSSTSTIDFKEDAFSRRLDNEVEKCVLFFLEQQGQLAHRIGVLRRKMPNFTDMYRDPFHLNDTESGMRRPKQSELAMIKEEYGAIGDDLVKLLVYLRVNVMALRKILKKHDKQARDRMMATSYLASRARGKYSFLRQLYNNEGVHAITGSLKYALENVELLRGGVSRTLSGAIPISTMDSISNTTSHDNILNKINTALDELSEAQSRTVSDYLTLSSDLLLEAGMDYSPDEMSQSELDALRSRRLDKWSAYLNLLSTFLYMANYYVAGPTGAQYSEALGGDPAVAGLIIGMTPIAACVSCMVYSFWTNTCFKWPLVTCTILEVGGNLLYGMALPFNAFWMVLVGRLLIGLGGARGINRRYIADTVPMEDRTFFSAAFVSIGALGLAFGPFFAALLNRLDFTMFGFFIVNGLTAPGYFMCILWLIFGVGVVAKFEEPTIRYSPSAARKRANSDDSTVSLLLSNTKDGSFGTRSPYTTPPVMGGGKTLSLPPPSSPPRSGRTVVNGGTLSPGSMLLGGNSLGNVSVIEEGAWGGSSPTHAGSAANSYTTPIVRMDGVVLDSQNRILASGHRNNSRTNSRTNSRSNSRATSPTGRESTPLLHGSINNKGPTYLKSPSRKGKEGKDTDADTDEDGSTLSAVPLMVCIFCYFVNKLITEAVVSSAPLIGFAYFDWSVDTVGGLMATMGLVTLPVGIAVGRSSTMFEDRWLMQVLAGIAIIACLVLVKLSNIWLGFPYTEAQYVTGVGLLFVALQAQEGVVMALTSKIIPARLAKGTFNSGFLATEAGTAARFFSDVAITVLGMYSMERLLDMLFVPGLILIIAMMVAVQSCYIWLDV